MTFYLRYSWPVCLFYSYKILLYGRILIQACNKIELALLLSCLLFSSVLVIRDMQYHNGQKGDWIQCWIDYKNNIGRIDRDGLKRKK